MISPQRLQKVIELVRRELKNNNANIGSILNFKKYIREPLEDRGISWSDIVDSVRYLVGKKILQIDRDDYDYSNIVITTETYDWIMYKFPREEKKVEIGLQEHDSDVFSDIEDAINNKLEYSKKYNIKIIFPNGKFSKK